MRAIVALIFCATVANAQVAAPGPGEIPGNLPMPSGIFNVHLSGANVVPPNGTAATGDGTLTLDGHILTYAVAVPFSWRHGEIHGPARPDANAPVIFDLGEPGCAVPNPPRLGGCLFHGALIISDEQRDDLLAGLWYVEAYSGAEIIRDQVLSADLDSDLDGVPDAQDQCPNTRAGAVVDEHGCSIAQLCPCDGPWRTHAEYVKCVRETARQFLEAGLITEKQRRRLVLEVATSNCGRRR